MPAAYEVSPPGTQGVSGTKRTPEQEALRRTITPMLWDEIGRAGTQGPSIQQTLGNWRQTAGSMQVPGWLQGPQTYQVQGAPPPISVGPALNQQQMQDLISRVSGQSKAALGNRAGAGPLPPATQQAGRAIGADVDTTTRFSMAMPNSQQKLASEMANVDRWTQMQDADLAQRNQAMKRWMIDMEREQGRRGIASGLAKETMEKQAEQDNASLYRILTGMAGGDPYAFSRTQQGWKTTGGQL